MTHLNCTLKLTSLLAVALTTACSGGGSSGGGSVAPMTLSVRASIPALGLDTLDQAIEAGGVGDDLDTAPALTLFAPSESAFGALPPGALDDLLAVSNQSELAELLRYHTLDGDFSAEMLMDIAASPTPIVSSTTGDPLIVNEIAGILYINDAQVTSPDSDAANGTIHVVDTVLRPIEDQLAALAARGFSRFVEGIEAAGLATEFSDALATPATLLAPTDAAIEAMGAGVFDALLLDVPALTEFIDRHRVDGNLFASQLLEGTQVDSLSGAPLLFQFDGTDLTVNGSRVGRFNVPSSNGVIHAVDEVVDAFDTFAVLDDLGLNTLQGAITSAGIEPVLQDPTATLTLFAPGDEAFTALATPPPTDAGELGAFLGTHVLDQQLTSGELPIDSVALNIGSTPLLFFALGTDVYVNDARVVGADRPSTNGVIHEVDRVLLPQESVLDSLDRRGLTLMRNFVTDSGFEAQLSGNGPFTLLAPTDAAIAALGGGSIDVAAVVERHWIDGALPAWVATGGGASTTGRDGFVHAFTVADDTLLIDGVVVRSLNVPCTNGVLYVLDAVLPLDAPMPLLAEGGQTGGFDVSGFGGNSGAGPNGSRSSRATNAALLRGSGPRSAFEATSSASGALTIDADFDAATAARVGLFASEREPIFATPDLASARLFADGDAHALEFDALSSTFARITVLSGDAVELTLEGVSVIGSPELDVEGLVRTSFVLPLESDSERVRLVLEGDAPFALELLLD